MRWVLESVDEALVARLSAEASVSPLAARLLVQRGITTAEAAQRFLHPELSHLHSPYLMLGMKAAVERIHAAIARKEKTLIYGDYDVDGTVAIVILKTAIELCGGQAEYHVPHRIREGYGMKDEVIERAAADGVRLIISVDTGIRAFTEAETAHRLGVDLIVTDHHLLEAGKIPQAFALLNPNQPGCEYPCKELCGAGIAFKIAQALLEQAGRAQLVPSFLKMAAIATIADAVPLTGENRVLARLGLEALRVPVNPGLKALFDVAQLPYAGNLNGAPQRRLNATDVAFRIAPRLNAAGRMDVARDVIHLFTERDATRVAEIAGKLNQLNAERQQEEARILSQAQKQVESDAALRDAYTLVLEGDAWHRGVIGIVATRIMERYGKPTLVIARDAESGEAHGSGRSIRAFHLLEALEDARCRPLFTRFGGHAFAAGFTLPIASIAALRQGVESCARERLTPADFTPALPLDAEAGLHAMDHALLRELQQLEPYGVGNREPLFAARRVRLCQPVRILKEKHIKLRVEAQHNGKTQALDALGWRMAERLEANPLQVGDLLDLAFTLEENTNPDFGGLQLVLKDFVKL